VTIPILILYPHSRCNCRCIMCDIWKDTASHEIGLSELERHLEDLERLSVQWVVLSGGEPLMHSDLFRFCALLRERRIRTTILSTGLLFERHAGRIAESVDDVIVSLDGPAPVHDRIRRVPGAFALAARGVEAILRLNPRFPIAARSTVQRENFLYLRETAAAARSLGVASISYLAADLTSTAFNRPESWTAGRQFEIALAETDIPVLEREIEALIAEWGATGFIREDAAKLRRIVLHYRAHLGLCEPVAPRCNAPWVSAVVEADGLVRPCFFHQPIGRLNGRTLTRILTGPEATAFRANLDVPTNPTCRRCVCSLQFG
jgi:Fe-coproporphyrin III synthase